jgi:hypothetical protein
MATEQKIAEYIENGGVCCPECGETDIEGGSVDVQQGCAFQEIDCNVCGASWVDRYQLVAIMDLKQNTEEVTDGGNIHQLRAQTS